ncbi:DUF3987 domain-containing protein [uncultured Parabacteroides sp.]|uniref:DUF3987 domain-containing protein n=1 Tax=uncultured Parabacteroides sp. TaxID=512312 RepID=UPI0025FBFE50|nr:DUF3987 domain-containing protein [uncultured Parabacteroides sp.]
MKTDKPSLADVQVSWFANVKNSRVSGTLTLDEIRQVITEPATRLLDGKVRQLTDAARRCLNKGKEKLYGSVKAQLPAVTFGALFHEKRGKREVKKETGLALMDFDHLTDDQMQALLMKARELPYIAMAWKSLSEKGVHFVVCLPGMGTFEETIVPVQQQLMADLALEGVALDSVCKDVSRCCFLNYDAGLWCNFDARPMVLAVPAEEEATLVKSPCRGRRGVKNRLDIMLFAGELERYFERKMAGLVNGSTATPTAGLAGLCNTRGYAESEAVEVCWKRFGGRLGQSEKEFRNAFSFVYRKYTDQFGSKKNEVFTEEEGRKAAEAGIEVSEEEIHLPLFPSELYPLLPAMFKDVVSLEKHEPHEMDACVLGVLAQCAAALSQTKVWENRWHFPSVFVNVVGKPASGKSVVAQTRFLSRLWEDVLSRRVEDPLHATFHRVAADTTLAKLVEQMRDNGKLALLMEDSEMNAFGYANKKQETGSFDPVFNKAYEGETVSRSTKIAGNIEVRDPKLVVSLTGTKDQFVNAYQTNQNGLTSRLTCYVMPNTVKYQNLPYEEDLDPGLDRRRRRLQERFLYIASWQEEQPENAVRWKLTEKQTKRLNRLMRARLEQASPDDPTEESTIFRLRAKIIRYACILSSVRWLDPDSPEGFVPEKSSTGGVFISDTDFRIACFLADATLEHTLALQSILKNDTPIPPMKQRTAWRGQLLSELPDPFRFTEAAKLCQEKFHREISAWKDARKAWEENGLIEKQADGSWRKVPVEATEKP